MESDDSGVCSRARCMSQTTKNVFGLRGIVWKALWTIRLIRPLIREIRVSGVAGSRMPHRDPR
jgi:hypothetical protein